MDDLLDGFARARRHHRVELRVRASVARIRRQLPASVAILEAVGPASESEEPWHRVTIHAERLDWIPPVLLALDADVVIEGPPDLRTLVAQAERRLTAVATA